MKLVPLDKPIGDNKARFTYWEGLVHDGFVEKTNEPREGVTSLDVVTLNTGKVYYYSVPAMTQYVRWIKNIVTEWNWGTSTTIKPNVSAMKIIGERLPNTIKLNVVSVIFSVPLGI